MKTIIKLAVIFVFGFGLAMACKGQEKSSLWTSIKNPAIVSQLKSFVAAKEAQAYAAAKANGKGMPSEFETFFTAADRGDWLTVSNLFEEISHQNGQFLLSKGQPKWEWRGIHWSALQEIWGAFAAFEEGDAKYSELFGNEVIQSIPPGSIYFGGTDPGRFIITAMQKSQIHGDPFFTLTQNALCDDTYLDYLRSMYGNRIYIPTPDDSQKCFNDFYDDLCRRLKNNQLNPGEDATISTNGAIQASGQVAVMEINALILKVIFDHEPNREFYIEESFPLAWMYLYLEPHGLILKLNHEQLPQIPNSVVQQDHDYWTNMISPMIGGWLNDDTSIRDIAAFVDKVFLQHDFNDFQGDPVFVTNVYAHAMFAEDRVSIAALYAWRAKHSNYPAEKKRMEREADFAFRQAWAMCPDSSEVVFLYVQFLMDTLRTDDAILIAKTCRPMDTRDNDVSSLLKNLEQYKRQSDEWAQYSNQIAAMEKEAREHPSNYTNIYWLTGRYLQMQRTNSAAELWKQTVSNPNAPAWFLWCASQFFAQTDDYPNLEMTLKKYVTASPNAPEIWYDLACVDVHLGKNDEAIKNLQTAIDLSDQRLKTNRTARDIRKAASNRSDFDPIRKLPAFQKLVEP